MISTHTPIIAFSCADGYVPVLEQFCVWGVTTAAWLERRPGGLRGCYKQHLGVEPRDLGSDVAVRVSDRDRLCRAHKVSLQGLHGQSNAEETQPGLVAPHVG